MGDDLARFSARHFCETIPDKKRKMCVVCAKARDGGYKGTRITTWCRDYAENNASKFTTTSQCHVYTKNIKFNKGIIDISYKNVTNLYSFLCKVIFSELCNINQVNATS